jgi:hypothetical protein
MMIRSRASSISSDSPVQKTPKAKTPKPKTPSEVNPFFSKMNEFCDDIQLLYDALDEIEKEMNTVQKDSLHWFMALPENGVHPLDYVEKKEQLEQLKKEFKLVMFDFAKGTVDKFKNENIDALLKQELKGLVLEVTGLILKTQQFNDLSLLNAQIEFFSVLQQRIEQILDSSKIEAGGQKKIRK